MTDSRSGPENGATVGSELWTDDEQSPPRPQSVLDAIAERAERERNGQAGVGPSTDGATDAAGAGASPATAAPRWPQLLQILLARLRGEQPFERCFLCLCSDDPRDLCAEHHDRLETIMHYGEAA